MWETLVSLRWKDVTSITKEKTALVIPNAILICTVTDKFFLTSFGARDKTYVMLFRVWQNALIGEVCIYCIQLIASFKDFLIVILKEYCNLEIYLQMKTFIKRFKVYFGLNFFF